MACCLSSHHKLGTTKLHAANYVFGEALQTQFSAEHGFILAEYEAGTPVGFASYLLLENLIRIPKLYVLPEAQGQGVGNLLLNAITRKGVEAGATILELNVKRDNPSLKFYLKAGFEIYREEDIPYFEYVLNDYVMRKKI